MDYFPEACRKLNEEEEETNVVELLFFQTKNNRRQKQLGIVVGHYFCVAASLCYGLNRLADCLPACLPASGNIFFGSFLFGTVVIVTQPSQNRPDQAMQPSRHSYMFAVSHSGFVLSFIFGVENH